MFRIVIGGLAILLGWEWLMPARVPAHTGWQHLYAAAARPDAVRNTISEGFAAVALARPLFAQSRRPPQAPAEAGGAPDELPRLSGIVIAGVQRHAIFEGGGKPVVTAVGDRLGDYRIIAIAPADVTVSGPRGTQLISLAFDGARRAVVTPAFAGGDLLARFRMQRRPDIAVPRPPSLLRMLAHLPRREGG